jgi:hypothetical protein
VAHIFINYHFFYGASGYGCALRGPDPDQVRQQIRALKNYARPAQSVFDSLVPDNELVFSITVDDGSRSVLDALPVFADEGVHVSLCVCGVSTLGQHVLLIHKINLVRMKMSDEYLWGELSNFFDTTFPIEAWPLRGAVQKETLYRYDHHVTQRLKTVLNYQLHEDQASRFIDGIFEQLYGNEKAMCQELYLTLPDLDDLPDGVDVMFHGLEHRLWSELEADAHHRELTPPQSIKTHLSDRSVLSIPFGMSGSFQPHAIMSDRGTAVGAFTMGRRLTHELTKQGFHWLHRYDQVDIFAQENNVRPEILMEWNTIIKG